MPRKRSFRLAGAGLAAIVGVAAGGAGLALLIGGDDTSSEIIAGAVAARSVGAAALAIGVGLVAGGLGTALSFRGAKNLAILATLAFVVAGFVGNYLLFAGPRLTHTGANVVVAGLILWLLRKGNSTSVDNH
jgi:hypothetical protein